MTEERAPFGGFVAGLAKVRFVLSAEDASQGVEAEILWAETLGDGRFRLRNIPFYVYGVSYGDEVLADTSGSYAEFRAVAQGGGHSTYRVLLSTSLAVDSDVFRTAWRPLADLSCGYELAKRRWIAIDVPKGADIVAAYRALQQGEEAGLWTFEEAHVGHVLNAQTH